MMLETIHDCLNKVEAYLEEKKIVLNETIYNWTHINYEYYDERHYEIFSMNGKSTKQYLHVFIYRHNTGRYELNLYTL